MARTSKKQETPKEIKPLEVIQPKMQSIAFDKNSNLYGISDDNRIYRYDFDRKEWLIV